MFSSAVNAVNDNATLSGNVTQNAGANKARNVWGVSTAKAPVKVYFGDRFVNGKFMRAGYY